jgi:NOL1/NOP2/fmu family ribosome biogenesis protein
MPNVPLGEWLGAAKTVGYRPEVEVRLALSDRSKRQLTELRKFVAKRFDAISGRDDFA